MKITSAFFYSFPDFFFSLQSLRGGNTRIALQQEKCPPLPEPSAVADSRLCEAKICQTDDDCSKDDSLVCCYNGCIHSCLTKVNPPVGEFPTF